MGAQERAGRKHLQGSMGQGRWEGLVPSAQHILPVDALLLSKSLEPLYDVASSKRNTRTHVHGYKQHLPPPPHT